MIFRLTGAWLSASSKQGCVPNAINESPPTQHYNLQITAHITVTGNNYITVTGLTNAHRANHCALHPRRRTVTPFSQQSQLEYCPEMCSLFTVIYCYLSCMRLRQPVSLQLLEGREMWEIYGLKLRDNVSVCWNEPKSTRLVTTYVFSVFPFFVCYLLDFELFFRTSQNILVVTTEV